MMKNNRHDKHHFLTVLYKPYSGYIVNVILPFLFFELWYVFIAFLLVVLLETFVVKYFLKQKFLSLFKILLEGNFVTTLGGYFFQGLIRFILGMVVLAVVGDTTYLPVWDAVVGNVSFSKLHPDEMLVLLTVSISIITCFILSIIIERKMLKAKLGDLVPPKLIVKSIVLANTFSYIVLAVWIYWNYLRELNAA
jgi:hypothetical protein